MTGRDRIAIAVRSWLLIILMACISDLSHSTGLRRYIEIVVAVLAINIRERISYYWSLKDHTLWGKKTVPEVSKVSL